MKRNLGLIMIVALVFGAATFGIRAQSKRPGMVLIPAGTFQMGDHIGFVDPQHPSDEIPIHQVRLDAFYIGINDVTTREYVEFLNAALAQKQIAVRDGGVYLTGGQDLFAETRAMSTYSRIGWDGKTFSVLEGKDNHPVVCIRWFGAAAYSNWLSAKNNLPAVYNATTWETDFTKSGFRLPTEAEWEYAARGGQQSPYRNFPWGDDATAERANWPGSKNPFRAGPEPWTTPVGFFDGSLRQKADFGWPGAASSFQTANGANGYGLYDMAGNVWQFVNDWYERDYYSYGPAANPPGPESGSSMPDGKPYRGMRGGNWYNGDQSDPGHARVSNRDPSYFRGPQDPNHPYYHVGFRVALPVNAESRPLIKPTPVQRVASNNAAPGGGQPGRGRGGDPNRGGNPPAGGRGQRGGGQRQPTGGAVAGASGGQTTNSSGFVLRSPEVADSGMLPVDYTGDGSSATLPLEWSGAPAGTTSYAVILHHIDPQGVVKWYWTLYNIPADVHSLPKNVKGVGTLGNNSVNDRAEYAPPHSQGPGPKTYIFTVYALSAAPQPSVRPAQVSREVLLQAMEGHILATAQLSVVYSRDDATIAAGGNAPPGGGRGENPPQPGGGRGGNPPPPGGQGQRGGGQGQGGGGQGQRQGGPPPGRGPAMAENKLPTSPNPGQTVGLYMNTSKAYVGYTLMAPKHNTTTYLMDNQGRVVNSWKSNYEPGQSAYLLPNGHLLRAGMVRVQGGTGGGEGGRIEEYDWDGKLVWEFDHATRDYQLHHDIKPLPNGHVLALMVERKSVEEAVAAGFNRQLLRDDYLVPDAVVEIEPILPKGGRIVWEWHVWDHLLRNADPTAHPELIDPNATDRGMPAFWNHMNSLDYNASLDQIVLSVRGSNEIWIIDHSTTKAEAAGHAGGRAGKGGDLIYRWGNPAAYRRGSASDRQLIQQHDAQWIPDGYPGAGHMTIFNNGYERGWSSIEEIVLPLDTDGRYTMSGKTYGPDKPVWHYEAKNRTDFFSSEISGAQRLPNGNTLICAGVIGHLFEVTPAGEIVWQYVNAVVRGAILAQGQQPEKDDRGHLLNAVFKVHRYAPDYEGLRGRDLTPKGVIERSK